MKLTYTTRGNVRGHCGHQHRTIESAVRCMDRDSRGCKKQGGYSDRKVVRGDSTPLTENEHLWADEFYVRLRYPV